jgi:hypothetical protein
VKRPDFYLQADVGHFLGVHGRTKAQTKRDKDKKNLAQNNRKNELLVKSTPEEIESRNRMCKMIDESKETEKHVDDVDDFMADTNKYEPVTIPWR